MIVAHVSVTTAPDYLTRREPFRREHIERLARLRAAGTLVAGGPDPEGRTVDLVYRLSRPEDLGPLMAEDPYSRGQAWTGHSSREFSLFVEPWEAPPIVLDGSRRATIVEGPAADTDMAQLALVELRGAGRLVLGGAFPDGQTLAVLRSADPAEAVRWLTATEAWKAGSLTARPFLYVL